MSRRAFTLIELLVVIGIVAVLLSVLLPALAQVRATAKRMTELAAARQIMVVYSAYPNDHRGQVIEGHRDTSATLPAMRDHLGNDITQAVVKARWVWPLIAYGDYKIAESVFVNEQHQAVWTQPDKPAWQYSVSVFPSFGMNIYQIGGDNRSNGSNNAADVIKRFDDAAQPTKMLVFASAGSTGTSINDTRFGYWRINPPTRPYDAGATGWTTDDYDFPETGPPDRWGWVHPRWAGAAITAHLDGHATTMSHDELRDMTYWSNAAAKQNDPDYGQQNP